MLYTVFRPQQKFPYVKESKVETEFDRKSPPKIKGVLEISTRSESTLGKSLSPFNLEITLKSGKTVKVESTYHGSKVFENGEQYPEMCFESPRVVVNSPKMKGRKPHGFKLFGKEYPTQPKHAFFDFLYICALIQRPDNIYKKLSYWNGYSDMFYSPRKDPNCQARAAAKYVSLMRQGLIDKNTSSQEILKILTNQA